MATTKVKICGITNFEDADLAVEFGADLIGFNFYQHSPRYLMPRDARLIIDRIVPEVESVGVFVNEKVETVADIAEKSGIVAAQLHGDETPEYIEMLKSKTDLQIIKALRVSHDFDPMEILTFNAHAYLLDTFSKTERGGTGNPFNWEAAKPANSLTTSLFLAGGLNPENVADAIRTVRPYAVDVASGVESSPGRKDADKMRAFIRIAKRV